MRGPPPRWASTRTAPSLLVTGASSGALSLNRAVSGAAADLLAAGMQVLHLTGAGKADPVRAAVADLPGAERYHVLEYLDTMQHGLAVADLAVCRAGAGTVMELAAAGVPSVFVPLPVGNGEQRLNAAPVVAAGGGLLVMDADLDPAWLRAHGGAPAGGRRATGRDACGGAPGRRGRRCRQGRRPRARGGGGPVAMSVANPPTGPEVSAVDLASIAARGRVHLVGVGGAGMSAVAALLAAHGLEVSGSDAGAGGLPAVRAAGVAAHLGHDAALVDGAGTVVVSSAIRATNPEVLRAGELAVPVLHRSQALAALLAGHRGVAVAGAHGKTTTSAMVAVALAHAGLDPSWAIGGTVLQSATAPADPVGGAHAGGGDVMVIEADESDGSFLAYRPEIAVVTNVEPDHLDHYGSREAFERAFADFAAGVTGTLVTCDDDPGARRLATAAAAAGTRVISYGTGDVDVRVGPLVAARRRWHHDAHLGR